MTKKRLGWLVLVVWGSVIAVLTLLPEPSGVELPLWCVKCGSLWLSDWLLNTIVFAPLGAALALLTGSTVRAALAAALVSVAIELLQRFAIPGRFPSLGDIYSNAAGATIGAILAANWAHISHPQRALARKLATVSSLAWLAAVWFFNWTANPNIPVRDLWGQWTADLGHLDHFPGQLLSATIATQPFPWTVADDSHRLRSLILADRLEVTAAVIPEGETGRVAPIVSIFDAWQMETLLLGQVGNDAVFRVRANAAEVGLWSPEAILDDALKRGDERKLVTLHALRAGHEIVLTAARAADSAGLRITTRLGPHLGWTLLLPPSQSPSPVRWLMTSLWLGVLLFPAAYWAGIGADTARTSRRGLAMLLGVTLAGLVLLPVLQDKAVPEPHAWLGTLLSAVAAILLGRAVSRNYRDLKELASAEERAEQ